MNNYKSVSIFLIFISFISFFAGFYFDENSAGAGTHAGDFIHSWNNIQIYLNNDLSSSLNHENFLSGRTPLMYILHELFNPFLDSKIGYRRSVFLLSLLLPILFYFSLRQRFKKEDNILLFLISSTVLLSPYFRTSSYWGLEENYGLISLLLSFLFLNFFLENNKNSDYKIYFQIILLTFFSSCCLYFDYKLAIIPIICFFKIIFSKKLVKHKIFSVFCYFVFSLPCIYIIILWGGLVQESVVQARGFGEEFNYSHIGYSSTMICFYLMPLLFFKGEKLLSLVKNFFLDKKNYYLISLFFVYFFFLSNNLLFSEEALLERGYLHGGSIFFDEPISIGKGYIHKLSIILFNDEFFRTIFTYLSFFFSWLVILIYLNRNFKDLSIVSYFFVISILLFPVLQEYFDPVLILLAFTFFNTKLILNYKNSIVLFLYLAIFLITTNIYYSNLIN